MQIDSEWAAHFRSVKLVSITYLLVFTVHVFFWVWLHVYVCEQFSSCPAIIMLYKFLQKHKRYLYLKCTRQSERCYCCQWFEH